MGIFDDVKELNYQPEESGDNLPRVYYFNGVDAKTVRTNGEFYTKSEAGEPWKPSNRFPDEEGYSVPELWFAPIAYREQWFIPDPVTKRTQWLAHYEPGARKYSEQIGFVRGIESPAVLVSKGMTSRALYGKGGVFETFAQTVGAGYRKIAKMTAPGWALYVPIIPPVDKKGNPAYTSTGHGSTTTPPVLNSKYTGTLDDINALYVGADLLALGAELIIQYKTWIDTRRGGHEAQPLPVHLREESRNEPQPYADDEIKPF